MALELAVEIYQLTKSFPKEERCGLIDQLRRAVASIGANIAESFGRYHYKDKMVFYYNARGSLYEVSHFLELAFRIGYLKEETKISLENKIKNLSVKLNNFINVVGSSH